MKTKKIIFVAVLFSQLLWSQEQLEEVVLTSNRIDVPFSDTSSTISIISSNEIQRSETTNLADLLRLQAGIDIRRRGVEGTQADVYIRGGGFDQVLLLIDGIKVDNPQTGHHTLNTTIPLDLIERIEIVKGASARVFGQNAFTGAINIVTKDDLGDQVNLELGGGAYDFEKYAITAATSSTNQSHVAYASNNSSDGYRYNTDFKHQNYVLRSTFNNQHTPIKMVATFANRDFGANGFYASPTDAEQYEETQSSLIGFSSVIPSKTNLIIKPRVYWKRGQDEYIFIRDNPSIYRNLHITHKLGAEFNGSFSHNIGITGFGIEAARISIQSNNLGERDRTLVHAFTEHRFKWNKWDITPGIAVSHYSDTKTFFYPGIDIGIALGSTTRAYLSTGNTYRIPTYTDLYYSDRTTMGNPDLNPEKAFSFELGVRHNKKAISLELAMFYRDAQDVIDYLKLNPDSLWKATNISSIKSRGAELDFDLDFKMNKLSQQLGFSYSYLNDDYDDDSLASRNSLNSLRHHIIFNITNSFTQKLSTHLNYRYAERDSGYNYVVVNGGIRYNDPRYELNLTAYNILDANYVEQNLIPMPGAHVLVGVKVNLL